MSASCKLCHGTKRIITVEFDKNGIDGKSWKEEPCYRCLACGEKFHAKVKVRYVRHQKYGGCTWGIGVREKA